MSSDNTAPDRAFGMSELGSALPGLSAAARVGLVNALKDKVQMLAGEQTNALESLSPNVKKRVVVLQQIQAQYDQLESKFYEEKAELEARYQQLYEPLYTKRFEIVNGLTEAEGLVGEPTNTSHSMEGDAEKGVPEFWLNAMKTNETLAMQISERDEDALKYLKDIKWSRIDDPKGFKLEFFFNTNPYFKNTVLTKTYHMIEDDEPILEQAIGTKIEWLAGKNLTQKVMRKKPKKGVKNPKAITKIEDCESFFNFFSPPEVPDDDEEIDQDTAEQLQELMEQDYEIGSTIRDKIIPHAVSWFTGEALQDEDYEDADDGDNEDLEDDEDDNEDDDEDDDDDDYEDQEEEDMDEGKGGKVL